MFRISIILGSVREGRMSSRVADFIERKLRATGRVNPELLDLRELALPMMNERLRFLKDPPEPVVRFGRVVGEADALVIVSPEYNGGYPGVLKNAIDYLHAEYKRKPVGIVTVSSGNLGGAAALGQLRLVTLAAGAYPIPSALPVSRVAESFSETGEATDAAYEKRADAWIAELLWLTEATVDKRAKEAAGVVR